MVAQVRLYAALVALVAVLDGCMACAKQIVNGEPRETRIESQTIEAVLSQHTHQLLSLPGVVGTAIGECGGKPCIKVLVVEKTQDLVSKVPSTLEGYPVIIEETGEIRALPR